jgi:zinc transport system ATP-binding protein
MEPLISCEQCAFGYDGRTVVEDLSFTVQRNDYLCIAGENGSGKSTLIKGILRLIAPLQGRLYIHNEIKQTGIGYLSQHEAAKKDFPAGAYEIVLSGFLKKRGLRPFYSVREKEHAALNMERLGITHLKNVCYHELSGGQQRRVLLARALCASEKLLILDEPAAGLDPLISAEMYRLLDMLHNELGTTIIMVTHALNAVLHSANHILHLKNRQIFFGAPVDYLASAAGRAFLHEIPTSAAP